MSTRSVYQRLSFVSLLIILSLLLPATSLPAAAQPPQAATAPVPRSFPVTFSENVGQLAAAAPDAEIATLLASATSVVVGSYHTCALTADGGVKCWGDNRYGALGDGTTANRATPGDVSGLAGGVTAIATGYYHTCALMDAFHGGGVKCWGYNSAGQLGDGSFTDSATPVLVDGSENDGVTALAAGYGHTCALTTGGVVKCWGPRNYASTPGDVNGLPSGVLALAAGGYHTCALMDALQGGGVKCWGYNTDGQLGDGTFIDSATPVDVVGSENDEVTALAAGGSHTCALTMGGGVKCWGSNHFGQLGDGTTNWRPTPVLVLGLPSGGVTAIAAGGGGDHTCALMTGGGVKCWGANGAGQLGDGTPTDRTTPVDVFGLENGGVTAIAAGGGHTCALMTGGGVKCWGSNYGQSAHPQPR